ncbi:hypothetical protein ACQUQU_07365 [Thalassolituus sp. LLYu03]|uniref:hypothetical protein n=1 Tax=Thalassolituus sp. LLYu03 TaxID=3421656 RepID=UPI003D2E14A1
MTLPAAFTDLVQAFDALPGIGPKAAARLALATMASDPGSQLATALTAARAQLHLCSRCFCLAEHHLCSDCQHPETDNTLWVVADITDWALLREQGLKPFVLHGLLSPSAGIGPGQIRLAALHSRIRQESVEHLKLCFRQSVEAAATEHFIRTLLADSDCSVERADEPGVNTTGECGDG